MIVAVRTPIPNNELVYVELENFNPNFGRERDNVRLFAYRFIHGKQATDAEAIAGTTIIDVRTLTTEEVAALR